MSDPKTAVCDIPAGKPCGDERCEQARKPYSPPTLTLQGRTADEVLQASHALLDFLATSQGPQDWRYAVTGYVRVVCAHLETLTCSDTIPSGELPNPPTDPPPPMTSVCPVCKGAGFKLSDTERMVCTGCHGEGSVSA